MLAAVPPQHRATVWHFFMVRPCLKRWHKCVCARSRDQVHVQQAGLAPAAHLEDALPACPELVVGGLLRQQLPQRHGLVVRRGDEVGCLRQRLQVAHHLAAHVLGAVPACVQALDTSCLLAAPVCLIQSCTLVAAASHEDSCALQQWHAHAVAVAGGGKLATPCRWHEGGAHCALCASSDWHPSCPPDKNWFTGSSIRACTSVATHSCLQLPLVAQLKCCIEPSVLLPLLPVLLSLLLLLLHELAASVLLVLVLLLPASEAAELTGRCARWPFIAAIGVNNVLL
jgi:hypothetical protein